MKITADSMVCEIKHGESLLDAVKKLDLDMMSLASRPLAAQIGGEVFNLRFTPKKDTHIHLLRYGEDMGRRVYERTLQFLFILAMRKEFPRARVCVRYSLGPGLFITVDGMEEPFNEEAALKVETEMPSGAAQAAAGAQAHIHKRGAELLRTGRTGRQGEAAQVAQVQLL